MIKDLFNRAAKTGLIVLASSSFAIAEDAKKPEASSEKPADTKADSSYALGYRSGGAFAQEFGRFGVKVDDLEMERFMAGFKAAAQGIKPELSEERLQAAMAALGEVLQAREKESAEANLKEGKAFLEENAKREGVVTLESGLQYEVLEKGGEETYKAPAEGEPSNKQFMVNYKGTLIDGTEFDASPEGSTVPMTLQVIPGFREALTTMPVGAKWKLFIPSELAYGEQRAGAQIGPNTALIFELELVEIKEAPPQPPGGFQLPGQ
jgi:FKBP-type peptidyl-prolyl cis-trans isomerase